MKEFWRQFSKFLGNNHFILWTGLFLGIFESTLQMTIPLFYREILNRLQVDPTKFMQDDFYFFLMLGVVVTCIFFPLAYFFHVYSLMASARLCKNLQVTLQQHVQGLSADFYQRYKIGEITARVNTDIDNVSNAMQPLTGLIWAFVTVVVSVIAMVFISWKLSLIFFSFMGVAYVTTKFFLPMIRKISRKVRDAQGEVSALATEYFGIIPLIQSFAQENRFNVEFRRTAEEARIRREHLIWKQFLYMDIMQVLMKFLAPLVLLFIGAWMITEGDLLIGDLAAFWGYWMLMGGVIQMISTMLTSIFSALASLDRIFELLGEVPSIKDKPDARTLRRCRGEIEFKSMHFRYPSEKEYPVLKDFTLKIEAGEKIALVGPSGAGKSTLLQLLMRFYDPDSGNIYMDGIDITDIRVKSLRENLGMVLQESLFFAGSIAANLRLAHREATKEEMIEALEAANAWEFVQDMPDGLETMLGERGTRLSGGQKQRLSITRVFLKNPPILLLDEATSALDALSEKHVQEAMNRLMENRTSITVAHRLSTVKDADRIIVMKGGQIEAIGQHNSLVHESLLYRELCKHQGLA